MQAHAELSPTFSFYGSHGEFVDTPGYCASVCIVSDSMFKTMSALADEYTALVYEIPPEDAVQAYTGWALDMGEWMKAGGKPLHWKTVAADAAACARLAERATMTNKLVVTRVEVYGDARTNLVDFNLAVHRAVKTKRVALARTAFMARAS